MEISDADIGLLMRIYWAKGGGARGSNASHKRLLDAGLAEKKGINFATHNEAVYGARLNITPAGKEFLRTGKIS